MKILSLDKVPFVESRWLPMVSMCSGVSPVFIRLERALILGILFWVFSARVFTEHPGLLKRKNGRGLTLHSVCFDWEKIKRLAATAPLQCTGSR